MPGRTAEGAGLLKVYGVILAGGGGQRLWGDKHKYGCEDGQHLWPLHEHGQKPLVTVGGRPMLLRVYEALREVVEQVAVVAPAPLVYEVYKPVLEDLGICADVLEDACAGQPCGPLAGILAGLRWAEGRDVFVVAGDMPFVDPKVVKFLADEAAALRRRVARTAAAGPAAPDVAGAGNTGRQEGRRGRGARDAYSPGALVPRWRKGVEPLHAVYRRESLPVIEREVAKLNGSGVRPRLVDVLEKANAAFIDMEDKFEPGELELAFANVNTPEDLERARALAEKLS